MSETIETILIHGKTRKLRPVEEEAKRNILHPPSDVEGLLYCFGCDEWHPPQYFHIDKRYKRRYGRRTECKGYRRKQRKEKLLERRKQLTP